MQLGVGPAPQDVKAGPVLQVVILAGFLLGAVMEMVHCTTIQEAMKGIQLEPTNTYTYIHTWIYMYVLPIYIYIYMVVSHLFVQRGCYNRGTCSRLVVM